MNTTQTAAKKYEVIGSGKSWYVLNTATRQLLPFRTRRSAIEAAAERNG